MIGLPELAVIFTALSSLTVIAVILVPVIVAAANSFVAVMRKYVVILSGFSLYQIFTWVFDNPIWWNAEARWGATGVAGMMVLAFAINTTLLVLNRSSDARWTGFNILDDLAKERSQHNRKYDDLKKSKNIFKLVAFAFGYIPFKLAMLLLWCLQKYPKRSDLVAFCVLSIVQDPFIATVYLRHGYKDGLRPRDVKIYLLSSVVSIGYWAIRNGILVEGVRYLLK